MLFYNGMGIFDGLNNEQIEAVKAVNGPVLILAGAGSGKTKTLTHRIAYLISQGISPENILAVTFTNKAAEEIQGRIKILLGKSQFPAYAKASADKQNLNPKLFIGTFHSFGAKILRQEIECLGYKNNFVIYDEDDSFSLAKDIISDLNLSRDRFRAGSFLNLASKIKSELENPENIGADDFYKKQFIRFYNLYNRRLKAANAVEFDDLIMLPVQIFKKYPEILKKYQKQYQYILVDEYQDTNRAQYVLLNSMAEKNKNIFAIGDPDQAIYGWRYADFRNILNFEEDYPETKVIKLEQNYRSTQNILNAAHEIISKNIERKEKILWTENPPGALVEVIEAINEREEAEFILNKIIDLNKNSGVNFDKIVVMYRTNAQSRVLEEACLYANLPYRVIGAVKFYQRKEVKDILAYLRLIQNQSDEVSLKRIIGILGKKYFSAKGGPASGWENLKKQAEALPPAKLIKTIIKKTDYYNYLAKKFPGVGSDGELESESRIKNIKELIGLANRHNNLGDFLIEIALMQQERDTDNAKKLNLMTLHSAKGLEFDAVFIAGVEEDLMPHSRSAYSFEDLEEERRLCYVGMTRAKKHLWLLFTKQRTLWGEKKETVTSRFIMELPPHGIKPEKYLGQHFILSKKVLAKMITVAEIKKNNTIIEIGPGLGTLTQELVKTGAKIITIEKDPLMVDILGETLSNYKNIKIIQADARKMGVRHLFLRKYKIVANLPYNVATFLIHQWLELKKPPELMVLMIQKEVAQRICGRRMNLLAISVQFYADVKIIDYIKKGSFWPKPKVDSAIIKIVPKNLPVGKQPQKMRDAFFAVVRAGFSQPRKQLLNNLSKKIGIPKEKIVLIFRNLNIPERARAENLSLEQWLQLACSL
ncbi:MAG: 16S rRNA (adenine(1518)-N(6)/adenine(1519)-N(6))-dimethyltransferase RsmA [Candidatus Azambacteria bacterium]|nr:16S rRNA (adenine(1518)-N(6)/adenine(1519)-N(6))-dimethyltransferase RsmA [Candidatus Azambacteria bacterium]